MQRRKTRVISVGTVKIGGENPVSIQSMCSVPTVDVKSCLKQIDRLKDAGCQIIRLGVPDRASAEAISEIRKGTTMPLVADIHFNHELALLSLKGGVDGLRINPGNLKSAEKVREVVSACKERGVPIRIGVNAGSLNHQKYPHPTASAMAESALAHIAILEEMNFSDIKVSLKASDVRLMVEANRLFATQTDYPLHLGVTEAGGLKQSLVKSSIGIGSLLMEGIGDTIRVSITDDVVEEIEAARLILRSLGLRKEGIEIISCPTCARKEFDVEKAVKDFEKAVKDMRIYAKVAIMGCVVNGPGEAREADLGVAVGKSSAVVFKKGEIIRKVKKSKIIQTLLEELQKLR